MNELTPIQKQYKANKMKILDSDQVFIICNKCKRLIKIGEKYYRGLFTDNSNHITCPKRQ